MRANQKSFPFPLENETLFKAQNDRAVYQLFARQVVPRIYVVDAEGVIRYIYTDNPLVSFEELEKAVVSVSGT